MFGGIGKLCLCKLFASLLIALSAKNSDWLVADLHPKTTEQNG